LCTLLRKNLSFAENTSALNHKESEMLGKLGMPELLVILVVALFIFGPRKLGELGKGLGDGIRGFKSALRDDPEQEPGK
jgi:sec-independent protein translocase protein TatA